MSHSLKLEEVVTVGGTPFRIKGFRPVGGVAGVMLLSEPSSRHAFADWQPVVRFLRISDVCAHLALAQVA